MRCGSVVRLVGVRIVVVVVSAFGVAFGACKPSAYRSPPASQTHDAPPLPPSVGGTGTNVGDAPTQPTPPRAGVPGDPASGRAAAPPACTRDADCVKNSCCHATGCVARAQAPACSDVMCTMECRPATLDCGGSCACRGGVCVAQLPAPGP